MRWIVLLITTVGLLVGAGASSERPRTELPATVQLKQPKYLAAACAIERRDAASEHRLPAFALPASPRAVAASRGAVVDRVVDRRGHRWVRESNVTARGPPRG